MVKFCDLQNPPEHRMFVASKLFAVLHLDWLMSVTDKCMLEI